MTRTFTALMVAASLAVACGSEVEETDGGRFATDPAAQDNDVVAEGDDDSDGDPSSPSPKPPTTAGKDDEPPATIEPPNTCEGARDLGSIVGDGAGTPVSAQGTCTEWVRIHAIEKATGPITSAMKLTATLVSPLGANFDLRVFVNKDENVVECTTESASSALPAGRLDVVNLTWGDSWFSDDSRTVSFEIRANSPEDCTKGSWALLIEGNK